MNVLTYKDFQRDLAESLDKVIDDADIAIVSRSKGRNVVIMNLEQYNAMNETLYLVESSVNSKRLQDAIDEMNSGVYYSHKLIEG